MALVDTVARVRTAMAERYPGVQHRPSLVGRSWTSPFAAAQPSYRGRTIRRLEVHGGTIYVGYGDGGPGQSIDVHSIDTRTGQLSGSELVIPGARDTHMRVIDGALYVAGAAPPGGAGAGILPLWSNRGGIWSASGIADGGPVTDLEAVPGAPGAVMVSGRDVVQGARTAAHATWLSVDGGLTWSSFRDDAGGVGTGPDAVLRLLRVGTELYAISGPRAWRWRKESPRGPENSWTAGWEPVTLPDHCRVVSMEGVRRGGNHVFAAWSKGPMWTWDGQRVRRLFGHLDFAMAFCTDADDGYVYAVTRGAGVVRSLDGVTWFRHPASEVWGANGIPAFSIAVAKGIIFVGDDTSRIHAVASTSVPWLSAATA